MNTAKVQDENTVDVDKHVIITGEFIDHVLISVYDAIYRLVELCFRMKSEAIVNFFLHTIQCLIVAVGIR